MGHTCNSIVINAPYDLVFDISNDIPRWTELFGGEYKKAEVVKKEGNKITFKLTDDEDKSWQSWRLLFKDRYFTYAEREEPKFPFKYMKIIWLYTPKPEGVALAIGGQTTAFWPVHLAASAIILLHPKPKPKARQNNLTEASTPTPGLATLN